jgi:hypothetical protein
MSDRYAYDSEGGFFVDMDQRSQDDPDLGTELLTDEVVGLLNELANARVELEGFHAWKRSVDEALNSGDGVYRP